MATLHGVAAQNVPMENPSSVPEYLKVAGDALYFTADDGIHGRELWKWEFPEDVAAEDRASPHIAASRGRARLVADLTPGPQGANINYILNCHNILYFYPTLETHGREPWYYDPARDEVRAWDFRPGPESSGASNAFPVKNGMVAVVADDGVHGLQLWAGRAGSPETALISPQTSLPPSARILGYVASDGFLYVVTGHGLARTDGLDVETVVDWHNLDVSANQIWDIDGRLLFLGMTPEYGSELWILDDSPSGARLLKDIAPGATTSGPECGCNWRQCFYFNADDGELGREPYRTDGTPDGTVLLKDVNPGKTGSNPHYWAAADDFLYFVADDGVHGYEIWRTDGTPDGTTLAADLYLGEQGSDPWSLTAYKGRLFFCANTPAYGEEIFFTDGTPEGTGILRDIVPGAGDAGPDNLTVFGDLLFFTCNDGLHGEEPWVTDGTPEGTLLAADIAPVRVNPSSSPRQLTSIGDVIVFTVSDMAHGEELWTSDGTEAGTVLVRDIAPGPAHSAPRDITPFAGKALFSAFTPEAGRELWVSDGTVEGTKQVCDLWEGPNSGEPRHLLWWNGLALFTADDGLHGRELWRSDGTAEDTRMILDATARPDGTAFVSLFVLRGKAYFYTGDPPNEITLWTTDGTETGTYALLRLAYPYYVGDPDELGDFPRLGEGVIPLREDLSEEALLAAVMYPCSPDYSLEAPVTVGNLTFFASHTRRYGTELCRSDGTLSGTGIVWDAFPGPGSSSPSQLAVVRGRVYFAADHPREGRVLWRTDGTEAGTNFLTPSFGDRVSPPIPVTNVVANDHLLLVLGASPEQTRLGYNLLSLIRPGEEQDERSTVPADKRASPGPPRHLVITQDKAYFAADDGVHGEELWAYDPTPSDPPPMTYLVKDILVPGDLSPK
ncbi:MAG TPA: hypothetical protein PKI11_06735 [Candidatus Hydrogenedentes bacterium]|nr:hypothetical protein [Candidatus Hydrogenedentota bacterium]